MTKKGEREEITIDFILGKIYRKKEDGTLKEVGCKEKYGYLRFYFEGKKISNHRYIYEQYHNVKLKLNEQIDHINMIKDDNRIDNLRIVNNSQNNQNKKKQKNCSSKFKGVCFDKNVKKWKSQIKINGKVKHLGYFDNELEAYKKWKEVAIEQNKKGSCIFIPI